MACKNSCSIMPACIHPPQNMILITILSLKTYYKLKIYTHSDAIIDKFSLDLEVQART